MTEKTSRRNFIRGATGVTALGAGAGAAAAQQGNGTATGTQTGNGTASGGGGGGGGANVKPDFGGYLQGAKGGTYEDLRGNKEVSVTVGGGSDGLAFLPTGIWIDPGTSVTFEWTTSGHNVVPESQPQGASWKGSPGGASKLYDQGYTYSHTFDTGGIYQYFCDPHKSLGMLGAIAVGPDVPTEQVSTPGGGGASVPHVPNSAKTLGVATFIAMCATLGLAFFFVKYGGEYEPPEE